MPSKVIIRQINAREVWMALGIMRDVTNDLFLLYIFPYPTQRNPHIIKFLLYTVCA